MSGDDKGKTGEVLKAMPKEGKVVVQGVNLVKRHTNRASSLPAALSLKKRRFTFPMWLLVDSQSGKATKVGYKEENGRKVRFARKSGEVIDK